LKLQEIREDIALHNSKSRILQTIACNAHIMHLLFSLFAIESKDNYNNVPISKVKQCYEQKKFSNLSKKSTQLSQCVLSNKNIIFSNFVQIKSINSFLVNMWNRRII